MDNSLKQEIYNMMGKEYGLKLQTPPKPERYEKVKEALEIRFIEIAKGFNRPDYYKNISNAPQILGSLYFPLKIEVVQKVVNEMFPKVEVMDMYFCIRMDGGISTYSNSLMCIGETPFNNEQAAELALQLLNEKYFDGDITLDEWRKG